MVASQAHCEPLSLCSVYVCGYKVIVRHAISSREGEKNTNIRRCDVMPQKGAHYKLRCLNKGWPILNMAMGGKKAGVDGSSLFYEKCG